MADPPDDGEEKTSIQLVPVTPSSQEAKSGFLLIISTKSDFATGRMFKLSKAETVLGRGTEADFQIQDEGISRRHASIQFLDGRCMLSDLDSTNGSFINGERVKSAQLKDGDKIQLGSTTVL